MFRKIAIVLLAAVVLMTAGLVQAQIEESVRGGNRDRAPALNVRDFDLRKYEGKVVLIGIWQVRDCEPCEGFIPWMSDMQSRFGPEGLVTVSVNMDLETAAAADLITTTHSRTQVVLDPNGRMAADYQNEGLPGTYLYDRNLNLVEKFTGFVKEETEPMEKAIEKLIKKEYKEE